MIVRCLFMQMRIETDPADRTQLRMTVASGDPTLTFEYVLFLVRCISLPILQYKFVSKFQDLFCQMMYRLKEFIKEQLVSIPLAAQAPAPVAPQPHPTSSPPASTDPGALLAGLL